MIIDLDAFVREMRERALENGYDNLDMTAQFEASGMADCSPEAEEFVWPEGEFSQERLDLLEATVERDRARIAANSEKEVGR